MKNRWTYKIFLFTFIIALLFSTITNLVSSTNILVLSIIITIVLIIGVLFDMIGVAVLTSKEKNFHARASKKIKGAKESLDLLKNSSIVASFCNDVVGDICGIVCGGLGAMLAISIASKTSVDLLIITIVGTALISSLTVGLKSVFKKVAINNSDKIVFTVGRLKSIIKKKKKYWYI